MDKSYEEERRVAKKLQAAKRFRGETKDATGRFNNLSSQNDESTVQGKTHQYKVVFEKAIESKDISFVDARDIVHGIGTVNNRLACLKRHLRKLEVDATAKRRVIRMEKEIRQMEIALESLAAVAKKIRTKAEGLGSIPEKYWSDDKIERID